MPLFDIHRLATLQETIQAILVWQIGIIQAILLIPQGSQKAKEIRINMYVTAVGSNGYLQLLVVSIA